MAYEWAGTDISVDPMHDRLRSLKGPCEWCHGNRRPAGRLRCQLQQLPPVEPSRETTPERLAVARVRATRKQGDKLGRLMLQETWRRDEATVAIPPKRELKLNFERQRTDTTGDPEGIRTPDLHRDRVAC